jgi:hypothetical protein
LKCRNSREWTDEDKLKKSISNKNSEKLKESMYRRNEFFDYKKLGEKVRDSWNQKILNSGYNELSFQRLKKRIVLEQNNKCNHCGICEWNKKPIVLELEHIDGDNQNNSRDNLEAICPNCHSQTSTWRGKNKKNQRLKISDDEIVKSYIKLKNIRQTLIDVGLTPKGGNYNRVHKLIKIYNLAP